MSGEKSDAEFAKDFGTANGNRTRILALKGPNQQAQSRINKGYL
jgi:hypothetical protein